MRVRGQYVWAAMDETTDECARSVLAVQVGILDAASFHIPSIVHLEVLESVNNKTVAAAFNTAMQVTFN